MKRDVVTEKQIKQTLDEFEQILRAKIAKKGNGAIVSAHEAFGLMFEEVMECEADMKHNDKEGFKNELIDVAVIALFSHISLSL